MARTEWTFEEERACIARARCGDERERERLVRAHEALMHHVTRPAVRAGGTLDDYMQQARMGLLHALAMYDQSRDTRFWTYARWWVRAYVTRYAWCNRRIVPMKQSRVARRVFGSLPRVERDLGALASNENVARALGVKDDDVALCRSAQTTDVRIDAHDGGLDAWAWHEPSVEELLDHERLSAKRRGALRAALRTLDRRGREIIRRRFLHEPTQTLDEVGAELHLSRERVRQLQARALEHLRDVMSEGDAVERSGRRDLPWAARAQVRR